MKAGGVVSPGLETRINLKVVRLANQNEIRLLQNILRSHWISQQREDIRMQSVLNRRNSKDVLI